MFHYQENVGYLPQPPPLNFPIYLPVRRPCFLTNRIEHARYVLSSCIHPFSPTPLNQLNELPQTILPPLPELPMTLKEMKDHKERMYKQYTSLFWKRVMERIRVERGRDEGDDAKEVVDDVTRYTRGFVYCGVYSRYNQYVQQEPLVSESAMENLLDVPLDYLGFYPLKKYLAHLELSLKGLSRAIFLARENAAFYGFLLHQLIRYYCSVYDPSFDLNATKQALFSFLESTAPLVRYLCDLAFNFLKTQDEDPHKLNVLALAQHSFIRFYARLHYVNLVLTMHGCFDTYVLQVIEDLSHFQHALLSIEEWNATEYVVF